MRSRCQIIILWLGVCAAIPTTVNNYSNQGSPIHSNMIHHGYLENQENSRNLQVRPLKKVFLTNKSITCNDGTPAGFYLRKSHTSKKWIIFLEGGWYCYDHYSCRNRWLKQRQYMTSSEWPDVKHVSGILSPSMEDNRFYWNANHVLVPYCTSDVWSGSQSSSNTQEGFTFMGSMIVRQVIKDLVPLGLQNSTDLLLAGSSAGGIGVMLNLDPIKEMLHDNLGLRKVTVKGITDSGWFLDRTPYAPTLKPVVDAIRKGMSLWQGKVPRACREKYVEEPWRCYFGYRLYPTMRSDLFVFQWLFDEAQMDADNVGAPVTKQQWDYIHKMGDALRQSFINVSAVFAPSCISHSVLTKLDWEGVKIDDVSIAEALHCWEQKVQRRKRANGKKLKNARMVADQPRLANRAIKGKYYDAVNYETGNSNSTGNTSEKLHKRKRRKHRKNRKCKKRKVPDNSVPHDKSCNQPHRHRKPKNDSSRLQRSVLQQQQLQQQRSKRRCIYRRLERCSWPQCNHSCPMLHNPITGEEMDFIELLKSFGLDMESVADALGIDMQTLNNMDHSDLLNLLTQQSN